MSQADLVQIILVSVEVVLGALAIIVGVVAIFGYNWINKQVIETAQKIAQETMNKFLKESNIKEMVETCVRAEANQMYKDMDRSPGHDLNELREKETGND